MCFCHFCFSLYVSLIISVPRTYFSLFFHQIFTFYFSFFPPITKNDFNSFSLEKDWSEKQNEIWISLLLWWTHSNTKWQLKEQIEKTNLKQAKEIQRKNEHIYLYIYIHTQTQPRNRCWIRKWLVLEDSNEVHTALVQQ